MIRFLRGFRIFKTGYKPTTNLVQLVAQDAKRKVELDRDGAYRFISGQDIELSSDLPPGYVIVTHSGHALGIGKYREGRLKSQVPRAKRITQYRSSTSSPYYKSF